MLRRFVDFIMWIIGKPKKFIDLGEGVRMYEDENEKKRQEITKQIQEEAKRFSAKASYSSPAKVVKGSDKGCDRVRKWERLRKRTREVLRRTKKGERFNVLYMPTRWLRKRRSKDES